MARTPALVRRIVAALVVSVGLAASLGAAAAQGGAAGSALAHAVVTYVSEDAGIAWRLDLSIGAADDAGVAPVRATLVTPFASDASDLATALEMNGRWNDAVLELSGPRAGLVARAVQSGAAPVPARIVVTGTFEGRPLPSSWTRFAEQAEVSYQQAGVDVQEAYPRILGPGWASADADLDGRVRADVETAVASFTQLRRELDFRWPVWRDGTAEIVWLDDELLAVTRSTSWFGGGAHPNATVGDLVWMRAGAEAGSAAANAAGTGRLPVSELFADGRAALPSVASAVANALRDAGASDLQDPTAELDPDLLDSWTPTLHGLRFRFPPYAVGPYVQGSFDVVVPYSILRDAAAPSPLLERLIARVDAASDAR